MDTLDIYSLPDETRVIVTVGDLRTLYETGFTDCEFSVHYPDVEAVRNATIKGEIA